MPSSEFALSVAGAPLPSVLELAADNHTKAIITAQKNTPAPDSFKITTSAPFKITPVQGSVGADGKLVLTVGPQPLGVKGDASVTVKIGNKSKSFDVRFI